MVVIFLRDGYQSIFVAWDDGRIVFWDFMIGPDSILFLADGTLKR